MTIHQLQGSRSAKNGTLILGGGFGGAHVARLLGHPGATIVSPEGSMLYTPLADGLLSMMCRRDITELGSLEVRRTPSSPTAPVSSAGP